MLVSRTFERWDYGAVQELERMCRELPILHSNGASAFFRKTSKATRSAVKPVARQSGHIFDALAGVVGASDRKDFEVNIDAESAGAARGILVLETFDRSIGVLMCVARIGEDNFLTYAFTDTDKSALKSLLAAKPPKRGWWPF